MCNSESVIKFNNNNNNNHRGKEAMRLSLTSAKTPTLPPSSEYMAHYLQEMCVDRSNQVYPQEQVAIAGSEVTTRLFSPRNINKIVYSHGSTLLDAILVCSQ